MHVALHLLEVAVDVLLLVAELLTLVADHLLELLALVLRHLLELLARQQRGLPQGGLDRLVALSPSLLVHGGRGLGECRLDDERDVTAAGRRAG